MNQGRYRAWRFAHPDFDPDKAGLLWSPCGDVALVEEDASVRQAVLLLLTTTPGERVMRPDYGCELARLVFSPNDDTTAGLAKHYVKRALDQWEPRIDVLRLDADQHPADPAALLLSLEYRIRATRQVQHLELALQLRGD
jgi:phage baseplate assembly protein W